MRKTVVKRPVTELPSQSSSSAPCCASRTEQDLAQEVLKDAYLRGLNMGDLVADYLEQIGMTNDVNDPWLLPDWFFYDLSLVLQLAWWEKLGLIELLPENLPHSSDVLDRIITEAGNPVTLLENKPNQQLGIHMHSLYRKYLAHCRPPGLRTEFHLDQPDPDALIECLAKFLVRTRHDNNPK